jgi:hypothetical protein
MSLPKPTPVEVRFSTPVPHPAIHARLPVVSYPSPVLMTTSTAIPVNVSTPAQPGLLAWLTFVAAAAAAIFAYNLLRQARRTTNMDIALRLLDRLSASREVEALLDQAATPSGFRDYASYMAWVRTLSSDHGDLLTAMLGNYEVAGLTVRTLDESEVTLMITTVLQSVCPQSFDNLRPYIDEERTTKPQAWTDFEWLAEKCRAAAKGKTE